MGLPSKSETKLRLSHRLGPSCRSGHQSTLHLDRASATNRAHANTLPRQAVLKLHTLCRGGWNKSGKGKEASVCPFCSEAVLASFLSPFSTPPSQRLVTIHGIEWNLPAAHESYLNHNTPQYTYYSSKPKNVKVEGHVGRCYTRHL